MSGFAFAIADVTTPCSGDFTVRLSAPANPAPQGEIAISGPGVTCQTIQTNRFQCDPDGTCYRVEQTICNTTIISLTLDGQAVSTTASDPSDTASLLAGDLATKINTNPNLGLMFAAAAFGNVIHVQARQAAIEYPWQASCSHDSLFSECAFAASLSPIATLGTR